MLAVVVVTGLACGAFLFASSAWRGHTLAVAARDEARLDREAAERVRAAAAKENRARVTRKPFDVPDSMPRTGMLYEEDGRVVELRMPRNAHAVFGRVPRGLA